eukprot:gnl/Chilomastix_cuspidata/30.p1 GENE.gnl/Chilomastix_cuspidata/30~~gnl/Chilomastix_cuspidata/30.p1  ORF type:complete len:1660 (+),score=390.81 gnl/Chilomastix_cuspidata/30:1295-6274(+)
MVQTHFSKPFLILFQQVERSKMNDVTIEKLLFLKAFGNFKFDSLWFVFFLFSMFVFLFSREFRLSIQFYMYTSLFFDFLFSYLVLYQSVWVNFESNALFHILCEASRFVYYIIRCCFVNFWIASYIPKRSQRLILYLFSTGLIQISVGMAVYWGVQGYSSSASSGADTIFTHFLVVEMAMALLNLVFQMVTPLFIDPKTFIYFNIEALPDGTIIHNEQEEGSGPQTPLVDAKHYSLSRFSPKVQPIMSDSADHAKPRARPKVAHSIFDLSAESSLEAIKERRVRTSFPVSDNSSASLPFEFSHEPKTSPRSTIGTAVSASKKSDERVSALARLAKRCRKELTRMRNNFFILLSHREIRSLFIHSWTLCVILFFVCFSRLLHALDVTPLISVGEYIFSFIFELVSIASISQAPCEVKPNSPLYAPPHSSISRVYSDYIFTRPELMPWFHFVILNELLGTGLVFCPEASFYDIMKDVLRGIKVQWTLEADQKEQSSSSHIYNVQLMKPNALRSSESIPRAEKVVSSPSPAIEDLPPQKLCPDSVEVPNRSDAKFPHQRSFNSREQLPDRFDSAAWETDSSESMINRKRQNIIFLNKQEFAALPRCVRKWSEFWLKVIEEHQEAAKLNDDPNLLPPLILCQMIRDDAAREIILHTSGPFVKIIQRNRVSDPTFICNSEITCFSFLQSAMNFLINPPLFGSAPLFLKRLLSVIASTLWPNKLRFRQRSQECRGKNNEDMIVNSLDIIDDIRNDVIGVFETHNISPPLDLFDQIRNNGELMVLGYSMFRKEIPDVLHKKLKGVYSLLATALVHNGKYFSNKMQDQIEGTQILNQDIIRKRMDVVSANYKTDLWASSKITGTLEDDISTFSSSGDMYDYSDDEASHKHSYTDTPPQSPQTVISFCSSQTPSEPSLGLPAPSHGTRACARNEDAQAQTSVKPATLSNGTQIPDSLIPKRNVFQKPEESSTDSFISSAFSELPSGSQSGFEQIPHFLAIRDHRPAEAEPHLGHVNPSRDPAAPRRPAVSAKPPLFQHIAAPLEQNQPPEAAADCRNSPEFSSSSARLQLNLSEPTQEYSSTEEDLEPAPANTFQAHALTNIEPDPAGTSPFTDFFITDYLMFSGPVATEATTRRILPGRVEVVTALRESGFQFTSSVSSLDLRFVPESSRGSAAHNPSHTPVTFPNTLFTETSYTESTGLQTISERTPGSQAEAGRSDGSDLGASTISTSFRTSARPLLTSKRYLDEKLFSWDFDGFLVDRLSNHHPLLVTSLAIHRHSPGLFPSVLKPFSLKKFTRFLLSAEHHYRANPYHTAIHAADALQFAFNTFCTLKKAPHTYNATARDLSASGKFNSSSKSVGYSSAPDAVLSHASSVKVSELLRSGRFQHEDASSFLEVLDGARPIDLWLPESLQALVLVAIILHDVDHPGYNNAFLQECQHPLANMYNNSSIIEAHSASLGMFLLKECGFETPKPLVECIRTLILSTDMSYHTHIISLARMVCNRLKKDTKLCSSVISAVHEERHWQTFSVFSDLPKRGANPTKALGKKARTLFLSLVIKLCDICNQLRPFDLAERWSLLMSEEFFNHGDHFKTMGIPIDRFSDRNEASDEALAESQSRFISFVVLPLHNQFQQFVSCIFGIPDTYFAVQWSLSANLQRWKDIASRSSR